MTKLIDAWDYVGGLSNPSKMPGYSYGLPASACKTGAILHELPDSICHNCYALKGCYVFPVVQMAQKRRLKTITKAKWVDNMSLLINHYGKKPGVFRWHDSGDLQNVKHLEDIVQVCKNTPGVKHWLPTREYHMVQSYFDHNYKKDLPENLCIRLSAHWVEGVAEVTPELKWLPTSSSHRQKGLPVGEAKESIECRAYTRDNECGPCRACWSNKVKNVSYLEH